ncbi:hypothetical protein ACJVC5_17290 [Peredibacter sp. HCB2-198]|uniref:hypothetical protein n=1 Tax=Peredibacter sp. HCB2-198 TaxID=3383025 RepID=UPI0038B576CC
MMKFILVALFIVAGCNSDTDKEIIGKEVRSFDPISVDDPQTLSRINAICSALLYKEGMLNILTSTEYTFAYSQKECGTSAGIPKNVRVAIQDTGSAYIFKSVNGEAFGLSNVETANSGLMKEICQNRTALTNPMQSASGAIWFSTTPANVDCENENDAFCIQVERGSPHDGNSYIVHTKEWMKVKLVGTNRGFFTDRKVVSSANCNNGESIERRAILK